MKISFLASTIPMRSFVLALTLGAVLLAPACKTKTPEEKKKAKWLSTMDFHLETYTDGAGRTGNASIGRDKIPLSVQNAPFLSAVDIERATVGDSMGAPVIMVQFTEHGTFVLDTTTTANKGKRMAIRSTWTTEGKTTTNRWLAAPIIRTRNGSGSIHFTPDATVEESDRIVSGLNNTVAKIKSKGGF